MPRVTKKEIKELQAKQKVVVIGVIVGALFAITFFYLFYYIKPYPINNMLSFNDRLIFTLQWNVFPFLTLLLGIMTVASKRFFSPSIDPMAGKEDEVMKIHIRYVDNTFQQVVIFLFMSVCLTTFLRGESMRIIPILAILFTIGRIAFWIGYLKNPLYRAPGMFVTEMVNYLPLLYIVLKMLNKYVV